MAQIQQQQKTVALENSEEHILVVKRTLLLEDQAWQGIKRDDVDLYLERIKKYQEFLPRSLMESDPTYKQIIPYIIFTHNDRYFLMQRRSNATEQRLRNKMSLGIGGHIRYEDMRETDILGWATREFHEEVDYKGSFSAELLGILNDDSNAVGEVHAGLVMLLRGSHETISVKSELKSGSLVTLEECGLYYDSLEPWSQMVYMLLKELKN
jgi:predicted NUDIX family phosphoesterase